MESTADRLELVPLDAGYIIGISLVGGIWSFAKHEFEWNSMETILLFWVLC